MINDAFLKGMLQQGTMVQTENGAITYNTSDNSVLDLFGVVGALRTRTPDEITELVRKSYDTDPLLTMKTLFYARDVRGGLGERRTVNIALEFLVGYAPEAVRKNLELIAGYGRWDDLLNLVQYDVLKTDVVKIVSNQLAKDSYSETPSLLAKWMPSENSGLTAKKAIKRIMKQLDALGDNDYWKRSELENRIKKLQHVKLTPASKSKAYVWQKHLGLTPKEYRQTLANLRKRINVLESKMTAQEWGTIDYSKIPSKAGLLYREAFLRNDKERYEAYLASLEEGTATVNSSTLFPYEIISKITNDKCRFEINNPQMIPLYNAMWENMADFSAEDFGDSLAVLDLSDSMTWENNAQAMKTALSMGLFFAENNKGRFKNYVMPFSTDASITPIRGEGFVARVKNLLHDNQYSIGGSTNIKAVFEYILQVGVSEKLTQSQLPKRIVIISDMEFDSGISFEGRSEQVRHYMPNVKRIPKDVQFATLFNGMETLYKSYGYTLPSVVFWNAQSRNDNYPVKMNQKGLQLVSGYSTSILKALVSGKEELTAYDLMLDTLNTERYSNVTI